MYRLFIGIRFHSEYEFLRDAIMAIRSLTNTIPILIETTLTEYDLNNGDFATIEYSN